MKNNPTLKKPEHYLHPGIIITGKWHKHQYKIIRKLGNGAVGTVYLCDHQGSRAALKISSSGSSITTEVNVLKTLQKVQGTGSLGPSLLDVDDWLHPSGTRFSFYVMEYVKGQDLSSFIRSNGSEWLGTFMMQLLGDLEQLHQSGWVFGDLKTDNLLVASSPPRVRWIDVGGTTQIGRSIKEYTEFFDRGYWNMGSRKAEPSYDLFAVAMVMLHVYHPARFDKGSHPEKTLMHKLGSTRQLKRYQGPLKKALKGSYSSSSQMKQEIASLLMHRPQITLKKTRTAARKATAANQDRSLFESASILIAAGLFYIFHFFLL
ncbi:protein kinase domain-containing protein [Virgibacillus senegalensis]|uniref:protein kinase domain-containing protein n=1 Tax=Virgibacillus senegalensis TaxID=1499679 RepID=UPI00069E2A85|nr:protein kinase [Virgibacillus senegalensis]